MNSKMFSLFGCLWLNLCVFGLFVEKCLWFYFLVATLFIFGCLLKKKVYRFNFCDI